MEKLDKYLWESLDLKQNKILNIPHDTAQSIYMAPKNFFIIRVIFAIYCWIIMIQQHTEYPISYLTNY